jgi:hypothetical protein
MVERAGQLTLQHPTHDTAAGMEHTISPAEPTEPKRPTEDLQPNRLDPRPGPGRLWHYDAAWRRGSFQCGLT